MSSDAVTYDEVLPERATVECAGGECCRECVDGRLVARAGDTIEVDCTECGGACFLVEIEGPEEWNYDEMNCPTCDAAGTLRVRLTEDPTPTTIPEPGNYRHRMGWRHVGTVVTDA